MISASFLVKTVKQLHYNLFKSTKKEKSGRKCICYCDKIKKITESVGGL